MCRTRITADNTNRTKAELWQDRLKEMKSHKELGHKVAFHLRSLVDKKVSDIKKENVCLRDENRRFQWVQETLKTLGISEKELRMGDYSFKCKFKEKMSGIPFGLSDSLEQAEKYIKKTLQMLERNSR